MAVSAPALGGALAAIVGGSHVVDDAPALARVAVDGRAPRWWVRPGAPAEVAQVLALATAERLAVAPRGAGTAVALGNPPVRLDVVLDVARLDGVVEYSPDDMVATVGAGMTLGALAAVLGPRRQRLPADPPASAGRTVGGVLATHASGPLRFRYGTVRDLLLGVRFVQADGTVTWGGSKVVKSVTGYDVPKLLVGSLGTLGVIVEATLRLHPVPTLARAWLVPFDAADRAAAFVAAVVDSTLEPERVVALSGPLVAALGTTAPFGALVGIGGVPPAVESQGARLAVLAERHGARVGAAPGDGGARAGQALDGDVVLALAGEPRRAAHWVGEVTRRAAALGLPARALGEAGSGLVRASLAGPVTTDGLAGLVEALRAGLAAEGGSLIVERAPAALKAADVWGPVPDGPMAVMRRIKAQFDPDGVLNPGRFVGRL